MIIHNPKENYWNCNRMMPVCRFKRRMDTDLGKQRDEMANTLEIRWLFISFLTREVVEDNH